MRNSTFVSITGNDFARYVKSYDGEVRRTHSGTSDFGYTEAMVNGIRLYPPYQCADNPPVVIRKVQTASTPGGLA